MPMQARFCTVYKGHSFEVVKDFDFPDSLHIIRENFPEIAALIQTAPCGKSLVSFLCVESGEHACDSLWCKSRESAIQGTLDTLLTLEP